jgi:hypothetical protein
LVLDLLDWLEMVAAQEPAVVAAGDLKCLLKEGLREEVLLDALLGPILTGTGTPAGALTEFS